MVERSDQVTIRRGISSPQCYKRIRLSTGAGVAPAGDDKFCHAIRYGFPRMLDRTLSAT